MTVSRWRKLARHWDVLWPIVREAGVVAVDDGRTLTSQS